MRKQLVIFTILIATCTLLSAQDAANRHGDSYRETISVGADGKFESAPDTANVNFTLSAQEAESAAAYKKASVAAEKVRQALRSNGIDPKTAELSGYSLQPVYEYNRGVKAKLIGFRVTTSVNVKLKDFAKIGPLMTAFADIEETANQSVNYLLEALDSAKEKAVEDAVKRVRTLAQVAATAGGRQLGELANATVDTYEVRPIVYGRAAMEMKSAAAQPLAAPTEEFGAQKITITAHVSATFNLR
jgi:uncharacterized protein YggE